MDSMNQYEVIIGTYKWKNIRASSLRVAVNRAYKAYEKHHDGKRKTKIAIKGKLVELNVE
jgi:hypothetical protein